MSYDPAQDPRYLEDQEIETPFDPDTVAQLRAELNGISRALATFETAGWADIAVSLADSRDRHIYSATLGEPWSAASAGKAAAYNEILALPQVWRERQRELVDELAGTDDE